MPAVRTTIEITPEQRTRLLELAARRGEKGFSRIVQEALDAYLRSRAGEDDKRRILQLEGALSEEDAAALRKETRRIRDVWR